MVDFLFIETPFESKKFETIEWHVIHWLLKVPLFKSRSSSLRVFISFISMKTPKENYASISNHNNYIFTANLLYFLFQFSIFFFSSSSLLSWRVSNVFHFKIIAFRFNITRVKTFYVFFSSFLISVDPLYLAVPYEIHFIHLSKVISGGSCLWSYECINRKFCLQKFLKISF